MFQDRKDAGKKLAAALEAYRGSSVLVLGIPRGGVEVGYEVSKHLDTDFSILIARKLPFPYDPESGFGAIAEDGSTVILREYSQYIPQPVIQHIIAEQKKEIQRRVNVLRGGRPLPGITGRDVVLVDDGIAMGSTLQAAIKLCKRRKPAQIIVAAPVAASEVRRKLSYMVEKVIVLEEPYNFRAVAEVYLHWYDVPDQEVVDILERWESERAK